MRTTLPLVMAVLVGIGLWITAQKQPAKVNDVTTVSTLEDSCSGMGWSEALRLAEASEWGDQLTEKHDCNEYAGTWRFYLPHTAGCSPRVLLDTQTKKVTMNPQCTGALVR